MISPAIKKKLDNGQVPPTAPTDNKELMNFVKKGGSAAAAAEELTGVTQNNVKLPMKLSREIDDLRKLAALVRSDSEFTKPKEQVKGDWIIEACAEKAKREREELGPNQW